MLRGEEGRGKATFSTSDLETRPSCASSRFRVRRLRTAFMMVMLCAWVKPPCSRLFTRVKVSKWWTWGGAWRCGCLCSLGDSNCSTHSSGFLIGLMDFFMCCLGWDSEASTAADLSGFGGFGVEVASGLCWISCGGFAEAAASVALGAESVFAFLFSRFVVGDLTSVSMAVARDSGPFELP